MYYITYIHLFLLYILCYFWIHYINYGHYVYYDNYACCVHYIIYCPLLLVSPLTPAFCGTDPFIRQEEIEADTT